MEQQLATLVSELIEQTKNKKVKWNRTSSESKFKLVLANKSALTIDGWEDENNDNGLQTLIIYNDQGDEILVYRAYLREDTDDYNMLSNLRNVARNSYFKVEETIASFLNELKSSSEIGIEEKKITPIPPLPPVDSRDDDLPF